MNTDKVYHPHHRETVDVTTDTNEYRDVTYDEWVNIVENVTDGELSYSTWCQREELMVMEHYYTIKNGDVVSYETYVS